jgi:hypothetical protein
MRNLKSRSRAINRANRYLSEGERRAREFGVAYISSAESALSLFAFPLILIMGAVIWIALP